MTNKRVALRYAKAILNLAVSNQLENEINDDMQLISSTIAGSDDLKIMLKSPVINPSDKLKVLGALFNDKVNPITKGLFSLLHDNKRIEMLESVTKEYSNVFKAYKNIQVAKVTTAVALTKDLEDKIQEKIVALTGNSATIKNIIDPNIIGGFILQIGDKQFDASIANKFNTLKKEFNNSYI